MIVLYVLLFLLILSLLIIIEKKRIRLSHAFKHITGPKEYPVIGSGLLVMKSTAQKLDIFLTKACSKPVSKLVIGDRLVLIVVDPVTIQEVLLSKAFLGRPYTVKFFESESTLLTSNCKEKFKT